MEWDTDNGWSEDFATLERYKSDHKISETVLKQRAIKRQVRNDRLAMVVAKNLESLCSEPKPGEQWRIITEKAFNAFALIMHILQTRKIKELYLAVYRINEPTVRTIIDKIKDGSIQKATFVISSFFNQTKKPEQWAIMLKDFADASPKCRHVYTHNHAKIVAIRTSDNDYFVFEGSGNMSDNARIEQYVYENSKEMFDFHKSWMSQLANSVCGGVRPDMRCFPVFFFALMPTVFHRKRRPYHPNQRHYRQNRGILQKFYQGRVNAK